MGNTRELLTVQTTFSLGFGHVRVRILAAEIEYALKDRREATGA